MYSDQSGTFCFMDVSSKSAVFLSEKDPKRNPDPDSGSPARPAAMETRKEEEHRRISIPEDLVLARLKQQEECDLQEEDQREKQRLHKNQEMVINVTLLKLEAPSDDGSEINGDDDDDNEGFRTPTSSDHRIPAVLECPGAPRKKKTEAAATKRKAAPSCRRRVEFDAFEDLGSLLPAPPFVVDVDGGDNNKKVKRCFRD